MIEIRLNTSGFSEWPLSSGNLANLQLFYGEFKIYHWHAQLSCEKKSKVSPLRFSSIYENDSLFFGRNLRRGFRDRRYAVRPNSLGCAVFETHNLPDWLR